MWDCFYFFVVWTSISLCIPYWPGPHFVVQVGLELTVFPQPQLFKCWDCRHGPCAILWTCVLLPFCVCVHLWYMCVTIKMHVLCVHMQRPEQHVRWTLLLASLFLWGGVSHHTGSWAGRPVRSWDFPVSTLNAEDVGTHGMPGSLCERCEFRSSCVHWVVPLTPVYTFCVQYLESSCLIL